MARFIRSSWVDLPALSIPSNTMTLPALSRRAPGDGFDDMTVHSGDLTVRGRESKGAGDQIGVKRAAAVITQVTKSAVTGADRVLSVRGGSFRDLEVTGHPLAGLEEVSGDAIGGGEEAVFDGDGEDESDQAFF